MGAMALLAWDARSRDQLQHYHQNPRAAIPKSLPRAQTHKNCERSASGRCRQRWCNDWRGILETRTGGSTPGAPICNA